MPPIIGRFVPFIAVGAANAINIPSMRRLELSDGTEMSTEDGNIIGQDKNAAKEGITKVVLSRISMAVPTMMGIPFIMNHLEKKGTLKKYPRIAAPLQVSNFWTINDAIDWIIYILLGLKIFFKVEKQFTIPKVDQRSINLETFKKKLLA